MNAHVEILGRVGPQQVAEVLALAEEAARADGVRPLNEHVTLHLRYGGDEHTRAFLLYADGALAGFAHVDPTDPVAGPSGELVVHPAYRRRGLGRRLLDAILAETGDRLRLWAHGDTPAAQRLAASAGFHRARVLWQMRRSLSDPLPPPALPAGVRIGTFTPGADEQAWLELNARAFADHPEQGAWTLEDLRRREREPWFDPAGFFLAWRGDRLAGFHWTKVHGSGEHAHEPIGEVYVVGVDPEERGTGLGRALTLTGLRHLQGKGLDHVMLYVDEDNRRAVRMYESLGFTRWRVDVMYRR